LTNAITPQNIYDLYAENAKGEVTSLAKYRGKVVLIVNVASLDGVFPFFLCQPLSTDLLNDLWLCSF
jgi:hypothetical protein